MWLACSLPKKESSAHPCAQSGRLSSHQRYRLPWAVVNSGPAWSYLLLTRTSGDELYHPDFADEENEGQRVEHRGRVTHTREWGYCTCNLPALLSISHVPDTGTCFIVSELFEAMRLEFQEQATVWTDPVSVWHLTLNHQRFSGFFFRF